VNNLVTVLLPVYNAEKYLKESLNSILNQTYQNIEILLINDASTDRTEELIKNYTDSRIRVIHNETNIGLAATLNKGISLANGKYIARMDADDISYRERLERQVKYLEENPSVGVLGTSIKYFGQSKFLNKFPECHESCKTHLLFNVCCGHPTVIYRKSIFASKPRWYKEELRQYSEEYDLYLNLIDVAKFANLPEVLLKYRTFSEKDKKSAVELRQANSAFIRKELIHRVGIDCSKEELDLHQKISDLQYIDGMSQLESIDMWLLKIVKSNEITNYFRRPNLLKTLSERFFLLIYHNPQLGKRGVDYWKRSFLSDHYEPSFKLLLKYQLKQIFR
jgi:glycosyltransferase involved in cell wall biosynthesis